MTTGLIDAAAAMAHCSLDRIKLLDTIVEDMEGTSIAIAAAAASSSASTTDGATATGGGSGSAGATSASGAGADGVNNDATEPLMAKLLQESDRSAVLTYLATLSPIQRLSCLTALR